MGEQSRDHRGEGDTGKNRFALLGDSAQQLVVEAHRSLQTRSLLPYNTSTVRTVIRESHSLSQSITATAAPFVGSQGVAPTPGVSAELTVSALALQRNKRALYVYHQERVDTIRERFWEAGGVLSTAFGAETETRRAMTTTDEAFAKGYADLCLALKTSYYGGAAAGKRARDMEDSYFDPDDEDEDDPTQLMDAVDLLGGGTALNPPKELMVDVRVIKDVGEVELLSGQRLNLRQGLQYHLAREDVEGMAVKGEVEIVE
ncbi:DNA replication protein psf1 [Rhodosporidiobolus nylandii]